MERGIFFARNLLPKFPFYALIRHTQTILHLIHTFDFEHPKRKKFCNLQLQSPNPHLERWWNLKKRWKRTLKGVKLSSTMVMIKCCLVWRDGFSLGWVVFRVFFWMSSERLVFMDFVFSVVVLQLGFNLRGDVDVGGCLLMVLKVGLDKVVGF